METQIVVSAIGKDRPGIVHLISDAILKHKGNITVQRSVKLGGDFAVILAFSVNVAGEEALHSVLAELNALKEENLHVAASVATTETPQKAVRQNLEMSGADQPGIINQLTLFLLEQGGNILAMDYTVASAPFSAAPVFNANVLLSMPDEDDLERLREGLNDLERDLNIEVRYVDGPDTAAE